MPKEKLETTYIYEAIFHFRGHQENLFVTMDKKDWVRIVNVLEGEPFESRFYGTDPCEGYEVYFNPKHVSKINLLENLPGIEFVIEKPKSEKEQDRIREEREQSGDEFIFRVWSLDGSIETYSGITFDDCEGIRPLEDNLSEFFGFMDEDGERVMLNLSHIVALEILDTFFLTSEQVSELLALRGAETIV